MKTYFTLLSILMLNLASSAQPSYHVIDKTSSQSELLNHLAPTLEKPPFQSDSRASTYSFGIDYDAYDQNFAIQNGFDYIRYIWEVNSHYQNNANFTLSYLSVVYDSLINYDINTATSQSYPLALSQLNLDSFIIYYIHEHPTPSLNYDTIRVTVFDRDSMQIMGSGPTASLHNNTVWDTVMIVNATIPLNTTNFTLQTFYPNLVFPPHKTFGIRVDFAGDTADKFYLLSGYRDECAAACAAEPTVSGLNTYYYFNYTVASSGNNLSGINSMGLDCYSDGTVGTPGYCELFYLQNTMIVPYVTATVPMSASIFSRTNFPCPGLSDSLSAITVGSSALPFTYSWSTTSGSLSSYTSPNPYFYLGNSTAVVSVTVTDANSQTASASVTISSGAIDVSFTNPNPDHIICGQALNLNTSLSGVSGGVDYYWSTFEDQPSINVITPGVYAVTVINGPGCEDTASIQVLGSPAGICVWPGDANDDGQVANDDLLAIGLAYGISGPPRLQQDIIWIDHAASDWADTLADGTNDKHVDTDGDGLIADGDTLAIVQNFGLNHPRSGDVWRSGVPSLGIQLSTDTLLQVGDTLWADISLGDVNLPVSSAYGVAFSIQYNPNYFENQSASLEFTNSNALCSNAGDHLALRVSEAGAGEMHAALTRIDHTNHSGSGTLARLRLILEHLPLGNDPFMALNISISDVTLLDNQAQHLFVNAGADSVTVPVTYSSLNQLILQDADLVIQPNPAREYIRLSLHKPWTFKVRIVDMFGNDLDAEVNGTGSDRIINIGKLASGLYFIALETEFGSVIRKCSVVR